MRAIGIDIGFASLGWGIVETGNRFHACGVIRTEKNDEVRKAEDSADRGLVVARQLELVFNASPAPQIVFAEGMSWPRDASVSAKMGIAWGVLLSAAARRNIPVVQFPPKTLKYRLTGNSSATKNQVVAAVLKLLPDAHSPFLKLGAQREHAADALGAALLGLALHWQKQVAPPSR